MSLYDKWSRQFGVLNELQCAEISRAAGLRKETNPIFLLERLIATAKLAHGSDEEYVDSLFIRAQLRGLRQYCMFVHEPMPPPIKKTVVDAPPIAAPAGGGDNSCVICLDATRTTAFIPCGHLACCHQCAAGVTACPVCRAAFTRTQTIYIS